AVCASRERRRIAGPHDDEDTEHDRKPSPPAHAASLGACSLAEAVGDEYKAGFSYWFPRAGAGAVSSARVSRLLVLGDLHCDRRHLRSLVERAVEERCDALVSLGDLCYLPGDHEGRRFLRSAGALLRRADLELLLVEGNHDD